MELSDNVIFLTGTAFLEMTIISAKNLRAADLNGKNMKKYINLIEKEVKDTSDVCVEICNIKDILNKARTALESADRIRRGEG